MDQKIERAGLEQALAMVGQVLDFGYRKYPDNKWKQLSSKEHVEHMIAHAVRAEQDEESGLPDLAHAACRALMALGVEMAKMRHCIVLSPYKGTTTTEASLYASYRDECLEELLHAGYAPFASHAIYPQVLDDSNPEERELGMQAGFAVYEALLPCPVFVGDDYGISTGMAREIAWFEARDCRTVLYRTLGFWEAQKKA